MQKWRNLTTSRNADGKRGPLRVVICVEFVRFSWQNAVIIMRLHGIPCRVADFVVDDNQEDAHG
jgi:hypothetical protein